MIDTTVLSLAPNTAVARYVDKDRLPHQLRCSKRPFLLVDLRVHAMSYDSSMGEDRMQRRHDCDFIQSYAAHFCVLT